MLSHLCIHSDRLCSLLNLSVSLPYLCHINLGPNCYMNTAFLYLPPFWFRVFPLYGIHVIYYTLKKVGLSSINIYSINTSNLYIKNMCLWSLAYYYVDLIQFELFINCILLIFVWIISAQNHWVEFNHILWVKSTMSKN